MALTRDSTVVSFDADAALEAALDVIGEDLRVCSEYDMHDYRILYVADRLVDLIGSEEAIEELAEELHSYVHIDFIERELFEEMAPTGGSVEAYVTRMEEIIIVRCLTDEEGVYFALERGVDLDAFLDAVVAEVHG
jgi:hypothetical protein